MSDESRYPTSRADHVTLAVMAGSIVMLVSTAAVANGLVVVPSMIGAGACSLVLGLILGKRTAFQWGYWVGFKNGIEQTRPAGAFHGSREEVLVQMQLALMVATAAEDERAVAALTEMMSMVTGGMTDEEVEECRTQALELYDAATDDED